MLTLTEMHITAESKLGLFDVAGYSFISNCRRAGKGGGVGAYIADGINWEQSEPGNWRYQVDLD